MHWEILFFMSDTANHSPLATIMVWHLYHTLSNSCSVEHVSQIQRNLFVRTQELGMVAGNLDCMGVKSEFLIELTV